MISSISVARTKVMLFVLWADIIPWDSILFLSSNEACFLQSPGYLWELRSDS